MCILVAVVIMFFVCWFPFHFQRLTTIFLNEGGGNATGYGTNVIFWIYNLTFYISGKSMTHSRKT